MQKDLRIKEKSVDVEFIPNFRKKKKPVVAWIVSKAFKGMQHSELAPMCDRVVEVLEQSKRGYCEAFPIEPKAMRGRNRGEDHALITEKF